MNKNKKYVYGLGISLKDLGGKIDIVRFASIYKLPYPTKKYRTVGEYLKDGDIDLIEYLYKITSEYGNSFLTDRIKLEEGENNIYYVIDSVMPWELKAEDIFESEDDCKKYIYESLKPILKDDCKVEDIKNDISLIAEMR